jgi:hypothetical protein
VATGYDYHGTAYDREDNMTTRREFERQIWQHLAGYLNASAPDEMGIDDYDDLSEADQARCHAAIERVFLMIGKHT